VPPEHARNEELVALLAMSKAALDHLDRIETVEAAPEVVVAQLRRTLRARLDDADGGEPTVEPVMRQLRRDLIAVESTELARLYDEGTIGAVTRRHLQRRLDLEAASLDD
jgi:CPA1 family monovalent cation:H+ antiporter